LGLGFHGGGGRVAPYTRLLATIDAISAGTTGVVSPKIAKTVELVSPAAALRRRVAVVTRSQRAAALLKAVLAHHKPIVADRDIPEEGDVIIYLWTSTMPDLRDFDEVVFVEYPWSSATIDDAVGSALSDFGPYHTTVLHSPGTIDDRLAVLSATKREQGNRTLDDRDIDYLLTPRW
jgi:hypothetical protein